MKNKQLSELPRRCEGWLRTGGAFSFGPMSWQQCSNIAVVNLTSVRNTDGKTFTGPSCAACWQRCIDAGLKIQSVTLLSPEQTKKKNNKPRR